MSEPLSDQQLSLIDAYWRASNYLTVGQIYLMANPLLREPLRVRAHQAAPARPLGDFAGAEFCLRASQPADSRARRQRHLYFRSRPRRSVGHVAHLSRGHLLRDLSANLRGRRGHAPAVSPVLVAGRRAESRRSARARFDQRRRRARLFAGACVRRGVRQSRSDRRVRDRRRRGGNRRRSKADGKASSF